MVDGCAGGYASRYRRVVGVGGAGVAAIALCGFGVCVLQSRGQSHQGAAVGRHRRVVVPAPLASGTVHLGMFGYGRDGTDFIAMGVVDCRSGLASFGVAILCTEI